MSRIKTALQQDHVERRRSSDTGKWFEPPPTATPASVWRPVMTEQQKKEQEQYIKDNNLPF